MTEAMERDAEEGAVTEADCSAESVEDGMTRAQEVARLQRELSRLSEQLILRLYDIESYTLREIAEQIDVTESRVSQLRTRALKRLRARRCDLREAA